MPFTVPEAKPPSPSASSHSAELGKGEDVLDPLRGFDEELTVRRDRLVPGNQRAQRCRPARLEDPLARTRATPFRDVEIAAEGLVLSISANSEAAKLTTFRHSTEDTAE